MGELTCPSINYQAGLGVLAGGGTSIAMVNLSALLINQLIDSFQQLSQGDLAGGEEEPAHEARLTLPNRGVTTVRLEA